MTSIQEQSADRGLTRRAEARRDSILEAALAVISRKGFHQTSIADIAGRAGVSRATVYQHFSDKVDILRALADRVAGRVIGAANAWPAIPGGRSEVEEVEVEEMAGSADEELHAVIDRRIRKILEAISADADAARLIARLARGNDAVADDAMRRIDDHVVAALTKDIQAASESGVMRACDSQTVARFLFGGIRHLVIDALDREEPLELDAESMATEIGTLVFFGLAQRGLLAGRSQ